MSTDALEHVEEVSRAERIFRGMLGMGMVFAVVTGAVVPTLATVAMVFGSELLNKAGLRFLLTVFLLFLVVGFGLGMLYGGILAVLARGRSFREVSILHAATAGAAVGLIPAAVVTAVGGPFDALNPLMIFPPVSAAIATAMLLIARRRPPTGT